MKMCSEVKEELELKHKQAEALKLSVDHKDKQISDLRLLYVNPLPNS